MWKHAKNSMKELKRPNSVFLAGYVRSSVLKTQKTKKTRETKTRISQNFPILWPIQGSTMSKSMPRAFQICMTHGGRDNLHHSFWPPKSRQISTKKFREWVRHKKFYFWIRHLCALKQILHHVNKVDMRSYSFRSIQMPSSKVTIFCDAA